MNTLSLKQSLLQVSATLSYYAGGINGAPTKFVFFKTNKEDQFYSVISIGVAPLAEYALINVSGNQVIISHCDSNGFYVQGGLPLKFLLETGITQEFITGMRHMIINHNLYPSLAYAAKVYYTNYEKKLEEEKKRLYEEENKRLQNEEKKKLQSELTEIDKEIDDLFTKRMVISGKIDSTIPNLPFRLDCFISSNGTINHTPQILSF